MNAFVCHHAPAIAFSYSCFDRLQCNAFIPHLQWGGSLVSFLRDRRQVPVRSPAYFRQVSGAYHHWLEEEVRQANLPLVEPPANVRRDDWVNPYFQALGNNRGWL